MNDTEASIKMAELAGWKVFKEKNSYFAGEWYTKGDYYKGEFPEYTKALFRGHWQPKENIAQAMEVLAGIGDIGYFWELTNNGDIDGHICQIWAKRSEYSASFDSLSHCIFSAVKKYLKEVRK